MRNLRKRRKLIRQMEQANKIPDKLMPQEIKDMLDVAGFRPVIENTPIPLLHSPLTPQVLTASVERPIRVFTTI